MGKHWTRCGFSIFTKRVMMSDEWITMNHSCCVIFSNRTLFSFFFKRQVEMFSQRYALILQRILRQDIFQPKLVTRHGHSAQSNGSTHTLTPVESLLGRSGRRFLLGMIVQVSIEISTMLEKSMHPLVLLILQFVCWLCFYISYRL